MPYRETLRVPLSWWLLAAVGVAALFLAYDVSLGRPISVVALAVAVVATGIWLVVGGMVVVAADDTGFTAGQARLPPTAIGTVEALDRHATARARGADADPHAYFMIKGYVGPSVRVWVADACDPVPYWLVSTRHPEALAVAVAEVRDTARSTA